MATKEALDIIHIRQASPHAGILDSIKVHGAVMAAMSRLYPGRFQQYKVDVGSGAVRLSSPLPVVDGEVMVYKPVLPIRPDTIRPASIQAIKKMKAFKEFKFIPAKQAMAAVEAGFFDLAVVVQVIDVMKRIEASSMDKPAILGEDAPGVSLDRASSRSTIFYKIRKHYMTREVALLGATGGRRDEVLACLAYLGDAGASKYRSSGLGRFSIERVEKEKFTTSGLPGKLLLSKYIPSPADVEAIDFTASGFEITTMTGFTASGKEISGIRLIKEGSVLRARADLEGQVVDLYPDYAVTGVPLYI